MSQLSESIYVAGSTGMVGSAIVRRLSKLGCQNILTTSSKDLDLTRRQDVDAFFAQKRPEIVILAAAKVGGINANRKMGADFIYRNLMIEANTIDAAYRSGVSKLIFLGSSCIYPKTAVQPIREEALLTAPLEPTNEAYAVAKIAGIKLCENYYRQHGCDFFSVMPCNLYGPNDNYDVQGSHVIPALMRKFHEAKRSAASTVIVWGTGQPLREFLYVDDLANAIVMLAAEHHADDIYGQNISHLNVGSGKEISIAELASVIAKTVGYSGEIEFDSTQPDGTPRKVMDSSRIRAMGWDPRVSLEAGLELAYDDFRERHTAAALAS